MIPTIKRSARLIASLALAVGLAGCGKNPVAPVGASNADDAAQQVALSMASDNGGMVSTYSASQVSGDEAVSPAHRRARPFGVTSADTTFTVGGVTFTFTRTYLNAVGNGMPAFDPVATWEIVETSRATGSVSKAQVQASIGRAGTLDIKGVTALKDTLRFNGTGNDTTQCTFTSAFNGSTHYFYSVMSSVVSDMLVAKPPATTWPYPSSGTLTWTVSADRLRSNSRVDVSAHFTATVVVTFNGTRNPDVVVDGAYHYKFDLQTGAVQRS